jgi:hypothetical protein
MNKQSEHCKNSQPNTQTGRLPFVRLQKKEQKRKNDIIWKNNNVKTSKWNKNVRNNTKIINFTCFAFNFPQKNPNMKEDKKIQRTTAQVMPRPRTPRSTPEMEELRAQINVKMHNLNHDKLKLVFCQSQNLLTFPSYQTSEDMIKATVGPDKNKVEHSLTQTSGHMLIFPLKRVKIERID